MFKKCSRCVHVHDLFMFMICSGCVQNVNDAHQVQDLQRAKAAHSVQHANGVQAVNDVQNLQTATRLELAVFI